MSSWLGLALTPRSRFIAAKWTATEPMREMPTGRSSRRNSRRENSSRTLTPYKKSARNSPRGCAKSWRATAWAPNPRACETGANTSTPSFIDRRRRKRLARNCDDERRKRETRDETARAVGGREGGARETRRTAIVGTRDATEVCRVSARLALRAPSRLRDPTSRVFAFHQAGSSVAVTSFYLSENSQCSFTSTLTKRLS